jgi:hypothetical protein
MTFCCFSFFSYFGYNHIENNDLVEIKPRSIANLKIEIVAVGFG